MAREFEEQSAAHSRQQRALYEASLDLQPVVEHGNYIAPRNLLEEQLARIWSNLLGVDRVGIHDNFFALGGHSLLALRAKSRIAAALQIDFSVRTLFEAPTIAELALEIGDLIQTTGDESAVRLRTQFPEFPESQLRTILQCRQPSGIDTRFERPAIEQTLAERFEQQVALYPDRLAVRTGCRQMTYFELNEVANRVAWQLLSTGQEGTRVGVLLEHGLSSIIAYLATMKAAMTCVFLDPFDLERRTRAILQVVDVHCVISDRSGIERLRELGLLPQAVVDIAECSEQPNQNPGLQSSPTAVADITCSSGSTGAPKAIVHSHRNRLHNAWNLTNALQICSQDRITHLHGATDGPAPTEIHLALLNGAALCSFDVHQRELSELAIWLIDNGISVFHWVPALFRRFAAILQDGDIFPNVRLVMLGSELATSRDLDLVRRYFSRSCGFVHRYGSVETLNTRLYFANHDTVLPPGGLPAGYALADKRVVIRDELGKPVPKGRIGEIVVCGDTLALGYYGQAERTASAFIAEDDGKSSCYRTGDLGRIQQDGCLEFRERISGEVKIRGRWVDLAQLEAVLADHPQVAECAVAVCRDEGGEERLTALVVTAAANISASELRSWVLRSLPPDSLPSSFVAVARLPRTSSGKLHRTQLSKKAMTELAVICGAADVLADSQPLVAPRAELEKYLVDVWEDVLRVSPIGIHDNLFDLGGDSLAALLITVRVNRRLGCALSPVSVLSAATIAQYSQVIEGERLSKAAIPQVPAFAPTADEALPLSYGQQRLWFLEQMEGNSTAYNMPYAWHVRGPLHVEALRKALELIIQRHEPLRTNIIGRAEEQVQIIRSIGRFELPLIDWSSMPAELQEPAVSERCRQEAERPFDLSNDVMLRASLLRLTECEHVLLLTMHHIACDGWSLQVLWRELKQLYDSFSSGAEPELEPLGARFTDYASWQQWELQGERLERLTQYWQSQLRGLQALELPTDRPRPARLTYQGARCPFELDEQLVRRLKSLSQREGVTLHMTLLAAFQVLLARYSGQDDIAVATPVADRNHAALEGLIGFFVNTLVLRSDLSGDVTFRQLLSRVKQVSLDAYDHQELPFEKLVEQLQPERHLNRSPLVQVVFQLLSFWEQDLELRGLHLSRLPASGQRVRFDLEMHLWQHAGSVRGALSYSTDLFDSPTMERMVGHFQMLLEGIVENADQRVSQLPLLTLSERQVLLSDWNSTAVEYPDTLCVHQLFEQQAARTPEAVALVDDQQTITYRELNDRANQVAHCLQRRGAGAESLIGISLRRSAELVIGILGILKAGAAYVPLDADYPRRRLQFMLDEAGVKCIVTTEELLARLPDAHWETICLDRDAAELAASERSNPACTVDADKLAYVMFTSGTTAHPKGVEIRHRSIARLVFGNTYATFGADRVFLQLSTVSFDASTFELWGGLLHGGKVVIPPPGMLDLKSLEQIIRDHSVTTLWLTATLFNQIVEDRPQALAGVDEILTGGEALSKEHVIMAQAALGPKVQLVNGYGPTESTTFATCYRIPRGITRSATSISIGRPIGNTQVYVLDKLQQPVPVGIPGELYIGGAGLARGYRNQSSLTAEKFLANPFSQEGESRLYRTGDRCRWRADGNLEFLGRLDDQVKLRGFRIELGEIESSLVEHPSIAACVVALREVRPGDRGLVAYCVPAVGQTLDAAHLRTHLRQRVPDYMVPCAFVCLRTLPTTSSGKIDRRALPDPRDHHLPQGSTHRQPRKAAAPKERMTGLAEGLAAPVTRLADSRTDSTLSRVEPIKRDLRCAAPSTPIEGALARIWQEELNVDHVGLHDNFFDLGGHSLLAIRVLSRMKKELGIAIPVAAIFRASTVSELARLVVGERNAQFPAGAVPPSDSVPLLWIGNGRVYSYLKTAFGNDYALHWSELPHMDGRRMKSMSIEALASHDRCELRRQSPTGPYIVGGYSLGGMIAFEVARQLNEEQEGSALAVLIEPTEARTRCDASGRRQAVHRHRQGRLIRHVHKLRDVGAGKRLPYLDHVVRAGVKHIQAQLNQLYCRSRLSVGLRIPAHLRWQYGFQYYRRAIANYSPHPFRGNVVVVVRTRNDQSAAAWQSLVAGQLIVRFVDCSKHLEMIQPPFMEQWTAIVGELIDELVPRSRAGGMMRRAE